MYAVSSPRRPRSSGRHHLDRFRGPLGDVLMVAAGVLVVLYGGTTGVEDAAMVLSVLCAVLLLPRRRYTMPVLLAVTAVAMVTIVTGRPPDGMFVVAGMLTYSVALYSPRRRPWFYAFAVWGALMATGTAMYLDRWWSTEQLAPLALILGGAGVGDSIRMRQAYIAEVTERARQAELTREEEARRRVMDERLRIARELHDVVAHHIAVISVHAGAAGHVLRDQPDRVWPVLGHIRTAADTVLEEIKSVIGVLRDPDEVSSVEPAPGLDRLPDLLAGLRAMGFTVRHRRRGAPRPLPAVVDLAAYRIIQEALTNAHRYGDGAATLDVGYAADTVTIEITNRVATPGDRRTAAGPGAGPGSDFGPGSGFGLLGMRERATAANGTITAGPAADGVFRVRAELPTDDQAVARLHPPARGSVSAPPPTHVAPARPRTSEES